MLLTVDRIEGNAVVCQDDDRKIYTLDRSLFPDGLSEGDRVSFAPHTGATILVRETQQRRDAVADRFSRLYKKEEH